MPHLHNPVPALQGVGNARPHIHWRDPLYDESRYMAYSSLTTGSCGAIHWVFNSTSPNIRRNVARLYAELRQIIPAFEQSYENPPFKVSHNHAAITRDFLTDTVNDVTTLTLEDENHYYIIVCDNSGVFSDVTLRMRLPAMQGQQARQAGVLNEEWSRDLTYIESTQEWTIEPHSMYFGDVNIWVISKVAP